MRENESKFEIRTCTSTRDPDWLTQNIGIANATLRPAGENERDNNWREIEIAFWNKKEK